MQLKTYNSFHPEHARLEADIRALTQPIYQFYPHYDIWFQNTFIPGLKKKERLYTIAQTETGVVTGCILMKNTANEKKICTLFVRPEFRHQGIGTALIRQAIQELGDYPLITIPQENMPLFFPLLTRLGFHLSAARKGIYRNNIMEYFFNDKRADAVHQKLIPVLRQRTQELERC